MRRTRSAKMVATLGPASSDPTTVRQLFMTGVDVFRLNYSHGSHADHSARFKVLRAPPVAQIWIGADRRRRNTLGLAVVAAIARAHGGQAVCLGSDAGGTAIEVTWPNRARRQPPQGTLGLQGVAH